MPQISKKSQWYYVFLRISAVCLFMAGFLYQTLQFLFLYWTYPTVVDIQMSSPSYVEVPAFTFCNRVGYLLDNMCNELEGDACANTFFRRFTNDVLCGTYPAYCLGGTAIPDDFQVIFYQKFRELFVIRQEDIPFLAVPLEDYLTCTIEFAGQKENCNMDNVMGSFYTTDELPQFCYTIYSKWGDPNKKREVIPKGATMKFHMFLNVSRRSPDHEHNYPRHNPPCDPAVQISVHSPYFLPSPFTEGTSFLGGRAYELRIKQTESHLLPSPYQTNCTDYMTSWKQRGGKSPIDQLTMIQECRINETYKAAKCIPTDLDYPHKYSICKACRETAINCSYTEPRNNCTMLADDYNQPCDSMVYTVEKEDKVITMFHKMRSPWASETDGLRIIMAAHDCEGEKLWNPECSTIDIDIPFDRFEITNITYNPKFESLEVFSVLGGYMGMWLGISLLTVYDLIGDAIITMRSFLEKRRKRRSNVTKTEIAQKRNSKKGRKTLQTTACNVW